MQTEHQNYYRTIREKVHSYDLVDKQLTKIFTQINMKGGQVQSTQENKNHMLNFLYLLPSCNKREHH